MRHMSVCHMYGRRARGRIHGRAMAESLGTRVHHHGRGGTGSGRLGRRLGKPAHPPFQGGSKFARQRVAAREGAGILPNGKAIENRPAALPD